jgi:hypothetical protein
LSKTLVQLNEAELEVDSEKASYKQKLEVLQQQEELIEDEEEQEQVCLTLVLISVTEACFRKKKTPVELRRRPLRRPNVRKRLVWLNPCFPTRR